MANPQQQTDKHASPATGGGVGSYPMQLVILVIVFAVAIGIYIYFTSGEDQGASSSGPVIEQTLEGTG